MSAKCQTDQSNNLIKKGHVTLSYVNYTVLPFAILKQNNNEDTCLLTTGWKAQPVTLLLAFM